MALPDSSTTPSSRTKLHKFGSHQLYVRWCNTAQYLKTQFQSRHNREQSKTSFGHYDFQKEVMICGWLCEWSHPNEDHTFAVLAWVTIVKTPTRLGLWHVVLLTRGKIQNKMCWYPIPPHSRNTSKSRLIDHPSNIPKVKLHHSNTNRVPIVLVLLSTLWRYISLARSRGFIF